ncbi:MAG: conserved rane protein of unknown function [Pseudonocardiales bacterium]|nr:conserved rane protein of unknown function [Pseudonocardiales bacterium]
MVLHPDLPAQTAVARRGLPIASRAWIAGLIAWGVAWGVEHAARAGGSWHFFRDGSRILLDPDGVAGGLHLYAAHPELQIGPLAFLAAAPFAAIPGSFSAWSAGAAMLACGAVILVAVGRLSRSTDRILPSSYRWGAVLFLPVWAQLSVQSGHLDDALALTSGVVGLWAVTRDRPILAALAVAAAADSKPWAFGFCALLLALPARRWLLAGAVWLAGVAAAWAPFFLADGRTIDAFHYQIHNSAASALRVLGVGSARTPPWCRTAQLAVGTGLAAIVALRRAPAAVLLMVIGVRLLLDPGTHTYYDAGLVTATLLVDVLLLRRSVPWLTAGAVAMVFVPQATLLGTPAGDGWLRAACLIVALAVGAAAALVPRPEPGASTMMRPRRAAVDAVQAE